MLVHRTERSGLRVAAGMDHVLDLPDGAVTDDGVRARTSPG